MSTPVELVEHGPSGSRVSIQRDGFEISSNTGTVEELQAELGPPPEPDVQPELPTKARPARQDHQARRESIQSRIDADTARAKAAKTEADAEESRLAKIREDAKTVQPPPARPVAVQPPVERPAAPKPKDYDGTDAADPEPTLEQFAGQSDPYTARLDARMDWSARKEARKLIAQQQGQQQQQHAEATYQARVSALQEKFKAHETKDPEFKSKIDPDVAAALQWSTPAAVGTPLGDLVMDSDTPIELMVHFSTHKAEFQRITALHPFLQAVEMGKVLGRMAADAAVQPPKPRPVSQAKPPIKPLGGTPQSAEDNRSDEELSDAEHDAKYAKMRRQYR